MGNFLKGVFFGIIENKKKKITIFLNISEKFSNHWFLGTTANNKINHNASVVRCLNLMNTNSDTCFCWRNVAYYFVNSPAAEIGC